MIRPVLILGSEARVSVPLARSLQAHEIPFMWRRYPLMNHGFFRVRYVRSRACPI
jgi:hypothetical protein